MPVQGKWYAQQPHENSALSSIVKGALYIYKDNWHFAGGSTDMLDGVLASLKQNVRLVSGSLLLPVAVSSSTVRT